MLQTLRHYTDRISFWLMMVLAFCLPLSTSAVSVAAILLLVCWLIEGQFAAKAREVINNPICIAVLVYFLVMVVGLLWTESLSDGLEVIRKRWKILILPIFLTTVRWEQRWSYLTAFIAGVVVTMLVIDLAYLGLPKAIGLTSFRWAYESIINHMLFTPMLALAIYLVLHQVFWGRLLGWQRIWLALLSGLMIANVFLTRGRAGQLAFLVLMALLLMQYYRRSLVKAMTIALIVLPLVCIAAYHLSPVFQQRILQIPDDLTTFDQHPKTSSIGLRLHYWKVSWQIIKHSPWLGVGTGDFASTYAALNQQYSPKVPVVDNPHNQYIFVMVQQGVLGLVSLLGLFAVYFGEARRRQDGWQRIRYAFPLFFLVIMTTESYLNLTATGFLFSLASGVLFKRNTDSPAPDGRPVQPDVTALAANNSRPA